MNITEQQIEEIVRSVLQNLPAGGNQSGNGQGGNGGGGGSGGAACAVVSV